MNNERVEGYESRRDGICKGRYLLVTAVSHDLTYHVTKYLYLYLNFVLIWWYKKRNFIYGKFPFYFANLETVYLLCFFGVHLYYI